MRGPPFRRVMRSVLRNLARAAGAALPRRTRHRVYRNMISCDDHPGPELVLKLAESREELEACFSLLHDAYVEAGFMQPVASGMRVTLYHALPTTSTLMATYGGRVVGTLSLIRDSSIGFPMQKIFDLDVIRCRGGNMAEVSALAVHRRYRSTGGRILFPMMKFMYEYATRCFDTRHLLIAVNPRHIAMYESLLFFRRLQHKPVEHYGFVNGAPAVGAHLDLKRALPLLRSHYDGKPPDKNLYRYFTQVELPNIVLPKRRYFTTNDPVMTPELLDYFFNFRTDVFRNLDQRTRVQLHAIYDLPSYQRVLPWIPPELAAGNRMMRRHERFSVLCPARILVEAGQRKRLLPVKVIECSQSGLRARSRQPLPEGVEGRVFVELGHEDRACLDVAMLRRSHNDPRTSVFKVKEADPVWLKFVNALQNAVVHHDLEEATRFM